MKVIDTLRGFFKRQLSAGSPRRIIVTVVLVAGSVWLVRTAYHEWHIMRLVSVMTQALQQQWLQQHQDTRKPAREDDTRA